MPGGAAAEEPGRYVTHNELAQVMGRRWAVARTPVIVDSRQDLERIEGAEGFHAVPFAEDMAAAGAGRIMEDEIGGYVVIHDSVTPRPDDLVAVRISGDSMATTLPNGAIVGIDTSRRSPEQLMDKIVCARTAEAEVVVKRLKGYGAHLTLTSDNPTYPSVIVDPHEVADPIIGQVMWAWVDLS